MRPVTPALEAWLFADPASCVIRHLVTITPRSGAVVRWTDHGSDLAITRPAWPGDPETPGAQTYTAGGSGTVPLIEWGQRVEVAGVDAGSLDLALLCGDAAQFQGVRLPLAATRRLFDGAKIKVERVFGSADVDVTMGALHLFEGLVMEARPSSTRVELEIEGGLAALNVEVPRRTFTPGCSNVLFDTQCGLVKATYTVTATVAGSPTTTSIPTNRPEADGYFDLGVLTFDANTTTAALRSVSRAVRGYVNASGTFTPDRCLPAAPVAGDTFTVHPGCPKTVAACETKFGVNNRARYRGFPHVPRDDFASPVELERWYDSYPYPVWRGLNVRPPNSVFGAAVTVAYGYVKIPGKTIWRGLTDGITPLLTALCEGPITGVDNRIDGGQQDAVANVALAVLLGTRPTQTPWIGMAAPADLGYPGIAAVGHTVRLETQTPPDWEWEVRAKHYGTSGAEGDADPSLVVADILSDGFYGAGFSWPIVTATGLDGTAASSYARYVTQAEMGISPVYREKRPALEVLEELCEMTNAEPLWSLGRLVLAPRADTAVGTYAPVTAIRYAFGDADIEPSDGADKVALRIDPETETYNVCPVTFTERMMELLGVTGRGWQTATEQDPDPVDVSLRGERPAPPVSFPGITRRSHALRLSRIRAQRQVRKRLEIEHRTGFRFCRMEPLDLYTITDSLFPFSTEPFEAREIREDMRTNVLTITGQEWTAGVNHATAHVTQSSDAAAVWPGYSAETRLHEVAAGNWSKRTSLPVSIAAVASNGSRLVGVGTNVCMTSDDHGETWTSRTMPAGTWNAVRWVEWASLYMAVGVNVAAVTPDGITWTSRAIPAGTYHALAATDSTVVAVGASVAASTLDGETWTSRTIPAGTYYGAAWSGEVVAAIGASLVATAPADGATWTAQTAPAGAFVALESDGAMFLAIGGNGAVATGTRDGATWTLQPAPATNINFKIGGLAWDGYTFCAPSQGAVSPPGPSGIIWTTRDGKAWQSIQPTTANDYAGGAVWSGRRFCLAGATTSVWLSLVV